MHIEIAKVIRELFKKRFTKTGKQPINIFKIKWKKCRKIKNKEVIFSTKRAQ